MKKTLNAVNMYVTTNLTKLTAVYEITLTTLFSFINTTLTLLNKAYLPLGLRLGKASFADSYWFLYSTKSTYFTVRYLDLK